ncbi:hypothetical protein BDM02DRAFT_3264187 [Thelephora ganbajun]|uniref:Uncharacterized protein n=1 Tax=Thelephora ganbajun TaxID=370292 RepID=A0ACB6Z0H0_THEGA|nr:hypothetical protein BDM02DRAFT_3264187 [Thelephora ganbajun]
MSQYRPAEVAFKEAARLVVHNWLFNLQNAEAEPHKHNADEDYTIVYIFPYFKYRITIFIQRSGRVLYNYRNNACRTGLVGLKDLPAIHCSGSSRCILVRCWLVAQTIEHLDRHRQRRENGPPSYMAFFLAFVISILMALVIEMYVLLPVKLVHDPKLVVKINRSGRSRPGPMTATKEAIGPAVGADRALFISIYPGVFTGVGMVCGILELHGAYLKWSQTARDKEFLVEMRLKNLEP